MGSGLQSHCGAAVASWPTHSHPHPHIPVLSEGRSAPCPVCPLQGAVPAQPSCPNLLPWLMVTPASPLTHTHPTLSFGSPSRPLAPDVGHGTSLWEAPLAQGLPNPQPCREHSRTARLADSVQSPVRPGSAQIRALGAPHWGTARSNQSPLQFGCCILSQWLSPRKTAQQLPEGKPSSAGAGGQPSPIPRHRHHDGLQMGENVPSLASSHATRGSLPAGAAPSTAQRAGRARERCQPLEQDGWHSEKLGAARQSWHRTIMAPGNRLQTGPGSSPRHGPRAARQAALGWEDTAQSPVSLGPGTRHRIVTGKADGTSVKGCSQAAGPDTLRLQGQPPSHPPAAAARPRS